MYAKEQEKLTNFAFCPMYTPFKHEMVGIPAVKIKIKKKKHRFLFIKTKNISFHYHFWYLSASAQRLRFAEQDDIDRYAKRERR